ncbi:complement C1q tumor necrosis factor-related protein 3-like isoform X1 [Saccostrea cucullata]|uniref:complement C1q tumor necrosis factor-related protein 3-like n=1 Tax=Saccostrea cuccullata TaxID=36930 RepID=UPI002ED139E0
MDKINPERIQSKRNLRERSVTQRSNETGIIAFYAYMSSMVGNPSTRLVLVFDVVRTNIGNAYHASTGVFIVPESGVYVFTWTFRSGNGDGHSVQLMINTVEYGSVYHRTLRAVEAEETGIVVAQVTTGDDVYVRIKSIYRLGIAHYIQSDSDGRTSFAGWKL